MIAGNRCPHLVVPRRKFGASGAELPLPDSGLLVNSYVIFVECDFVADLHLVEEPVRIALQNFREMNANIAGWFAKSVHDPAQGRFVNAKHSCQAVLPDARGVHPKLQVRVNVSVQCHGYTLNFNWLRLSEEQKQQLLEPCNAIRLPNSKALICQHIVARPELDNS